MEYEVKSKSERPSRLGMEHCSIALTWEAENPYEAVRMHILYLTRGDHVHIDILSVNKAGE